MYSPEGNSFALGLVQSRNSQEEVRDQSIQMTSIAWTDDNDQNSEKSKTTMSKNCSICCGVLIGALVCAIALAAILTIWLAPRSSNTTAVVNTSGDTINRVTYTTVTTTSVSTSTSSTSTTTSVTTSSSTSTTTSTTTTTSASTTTTSDRCNILRWNTTGVIVAGTGVPGTTSSQLDYPHGIYIDSNDILYVCDYYNHRIQKWIIGATTGSTVAGDSNAAPGSGPSDLRRPIDVTFDQNGYMYVVDQGNDRVQYFAPNSTIGFTVAGTGNGGQSTSQLRNPSGIAIDEYSNLYITDTGNERVMKWSSNATAGTIIVSSNTLEDPYGIIVKHGFPDEMYVSDTQKDTVQLWSAGATQPNQTLAGVGSMDLREPRAIKFDLYDNLYVANYNEGDIRKFCAGSTTPIVVISSPSATPSLIRPTGIAFDSNYNLYVADYTRHYVLKFSRL